MEIYGSYTYTNLIGYMVLNNLGYDSNCIIFHIAKNLIHDVDMRYIILVGIRLRTTYYICLQSFIYILYVVLVYGMDWFGVLSSGVEAYFIWYECFSIVDLAYYASFDELATLWVGHAFKAMGHG